MYRHRRLANLRRILNDDSLRMRARVAAALLLLYAQPVTRIVRLTADGVVDEGATATVRLGDPPSPLPEPVADLSVRTSSPAGTCPTPAAEAHTGSSPVASPDSR